MNRFVATLLLITLILFFSLACDNSSDDDDDNDDAIDDDDDATDDDDMVDDDDDDDDTLDDDDTADDDTDDDESINPDEPSDDIGVFVAMSGDDNNPGTMESPVRTIAHGLELAATADKVVFVAEGDYGEHVAPATSLFGGYCLPSWQRNLTECPVTLEQIEIIGSGADKTPRLWIDGAHIELTMPAGISDPAMLIENAKVGLANNKIICNDDSNYQTALEANATDLIAENNHIESADLLGPDWGIDGETIAVDLQDCTAEFRYNTIRSGSVQVGDKGISVAYTAAMRAFSCDLLLIRNRLLSGPAVNAVFAYSMALTFGSGNITMINNLCRAQIGTASIAATIGGEEPTSALLINNTFVSSISVYLGGALWLSDNPEITAINNIIRTGYVYPDGGGVIWLDDAYGSDNIRLLNNDLHALDQVPLMKINSTTITDIDTVNTCEWPTCAEAESNLNVDPAFIGAENFHLKSNSPCIDAGLDPSPWYDGDAIYTDIDGDARPFGENWDIGMDEYMP